MRGRMGPVARRAVEARSDQRDWSAASHERKRRLHLQYRLERHLIDRFGFHHDLIGSTEFDGMTPYLDVECFRFRFVESLTELSLEATWVDRDGRHGRFVPARTLADLGEVVRRMEARAAA